MMWLQHTIRGGVPLKRKQKQSSRRVKTKGGSLQETVISEEHKWILATEALKKGRLAAPGISNRHTAIKGMPVVPRQEAASIMKTLLWLRGVTTRKEKFLHEGGGLKLKKRAVTGRTVAKGWEAVAAAEDWQSALRSSYLPRCRGAPRQHLPIVFCPRSFCRRPKSTQEVKLLNSRGGCAKLVCCGCQSNTAAEKWLCSCGELLIKCLRHGLDQRKVGYQIAEIGRRKKRKREVIKGGVDKSIPKSRGTQEVCLGHMPKTVTQRGVPPGGRLAVKSPQLIDHNMAPVTRTRTYETDS